MRQPPLGDDPHRRSPAELALAYARGAGWVLPQILAAPWLPPAALRALAARRLHALLRFAAEASPYYREALAPHRGQLGLDGLRALPLLDKVVLREEGPRLLTRPRAGLQERRSSGSTGVPVSVYFDPLGDLPRRVQELRYLSAHGFRPQHSQLVVDAPAHMPPSRFALQRLGIWRREVWPHWLGEEASIEWVRARRPDFVVGVLSGVRMLALRAERHGGLGYAPHAVVTKGELLDPSTRWFLEGAYGAPVVDLYATEEVGIVAWECPAGGGYHVDADLVHLEVLRDDGAHADPGEVGEIVVTNLYQRAMPMIRFRTGDLGVLTGEPCRCGRGLPVLRELRGRRLDCVVAPDGTLHDPFRVVGVMEQVDGVRWFRIRQESLARLVIELAWEDGMGATARAEAGDQVRAAIRERLGAIEVALREVPVPELAVGAKHPVLEGLPREELEGWMARARRYEV